MRVKGFEMLIKWFLNNVTSNCSNNIFIPAFEGEGEGGTGEGGTGEGGTGDGGTGTGDDEKKFTQKQVNSMMAEEKRQHKEQQRKTLDELNAIKTRANLTAEERAELDTKIEDLTNQLMTKDELAKKDKEKLDKKHATEITEITTERDTWKNKYRTSTIQRAITDAAIDFDAFNPKHLVPILEPNTRLVEVKDDDDNPTGEYTPMVKLTTKNDKGATVVLDLTPEQAVKQMTEMDEHKTLFKPQGSGGIGRRNVSGGSGKKPDAQKLAGSDPEAYRKARKDGVIKFD
jgi:hypothetical protein